MTDEERAIKAARDIAQQVGLDDATAHANEINAVMAVNKMVVAEAITEYTFIDMMLGDIITCHFLHVDPGIVRGPQTPITGVERIFSHHVLEDMFLLRKLAIVNAIEKFPSNILSMVHKINDLRNALAHSFFPERRRAYVNTGKVLYSGLDIHSPEGLTKFTRDTLQINRELTRRLFSPQFA